MAHLSVKVEAGSKLTLDHIHSRPANILVPNWSVGKPAAFDLSVTSPLNVNIRLEAGVTAGAAARATELRKHEENDGKCRDLEWVCRPMVVEAYGYGARGVVSYRCINVLGIFKSVRAQDMCNQFDRGYEKEMEILFSCIYKTVHYTCTCRVYKIYSNLAYTYREYRQWWQKYIWNYSAADYTLLFLI